MKTLFFALICAVVLCGCIDNSSKSTDTKTAPKSDKPAGVPSAVYEKVKGIENKHNSDIENTLKEMK